MIEISIEGIKVGDRRFNVFADHLYAEYLGSEFEPDTCKLISCFGGGKSCLDVGANIGMTTLLMSDLFDEVFSFEPAPSTFKILQKNIERNKLENITTFNVGLGSKAMISEIQFSEGNRSGGFINDNTKASVGHVTEQVKIGKGDDLLFGTACNPAFIKIDVEGYELNALHGLECTIKENEPVVMLEANHWCLNAFQRTSMPDFVDELLKVFPCVYATNNGTYLDLNDYSDRYVFFYSNILRNEFVDIVGGFHSTQFSKFMSTFSKLL